MPTVPARMQRAKSKWSHFRDTAPDETTVGRLQLARKLHRTRREREKSNPNLVPDPK